MTERLFEIKTLKSIILKNCFEIIKPYIKETNLIINKDGIKISTTDESKVSLTFIKLDANKFESFYCERPVIIGIDTVILFKSIKSVTRRDTITFYMNKNEEDKLGIELTDLFMGKVKNYKLPLLVLDNAIKTIPEIQYDYVINIPSIQFQQIIKDIHLLEGTHVDIKSIGKQLIFSSNDGVAEYTTLITEIDENTNKHQRELLQQNGEDVRTAKFTSEYSNKIVQGRYNLSYLMYFIKASHLCDNLNILISNDKPLILEYYVADLGIMRFLLMGSIVE